MMDKVKLTKNQAKELGAFKKSGHTLEDWIHQKNNPNYTHSIIYDLTLDDMAKVLYVNNSYEVAETFKSGDKVITVWEGTKSIYTLEEFYPEISNAAEGRGWRLVGEHFGIHEKHICHATPEEVYWLETLGRERIGDFREGDVIFTELNVPIIIGDYDVPGKLISMEKTLKFYKNKALKGIYPAESFKPFPNTER